LCFTEEKVCIIRQLLAMFMFIRELLIAVSFDDTTSIIWVKALGLSTYL
jgi:hypothetical protein